MVRKTLNQEKKMSAEIEQSEALIESSISKLRNTLREGERTIKTLSKQ